MMRQMLPAKIMVVDENEVDPGFHTHMHTPCYNLLIEFHDPKLNKTVKATLNATLVEVVEDEGWMRGE